MSATIESATKTVWAIDAAHSTVEYSTKHMMVTTTKGRMSIASGTITLDEANPADSTVEVVLDVTTLNSGDEKRDAHLKSPDFFDAEKYPTITFTSTRVIPNGRDRLTVEGDLTIHGVTRTVALDTSYEGQGKTPFGTEVIAYTAQTKINREDFGLTWNVALETGGMLVGKDIKITIDAQATKQN